MTILQVNSRSIDQKSGEICTVQADLQPISFKSDRLLEDLIARIPEMQEKARQRAEREKRDPLPGAPLPKNVVQLPLWQEPVRAVPNGFLRSALFGAIAKGRRRYINGELIAAVDGVEIRYKGERLDQSDLDVWESVLHAVRLQGLGCRCHLTSYALLIVAHQVDILPSLKAGDSYGAHAWH